jgi:vacuolar-type H+-ATPase subunit C/Vma6
MLSETLNANAFEGRQQSPPNPSRLIKKKNSFLRDSFFVPKDESWFERALDRIYVEDFRRSSQQRKRRKDRYIQSQGTVI